MGPALITFLNFTWSLHPHPHTVLADGGRNDLERSLRGRHWATWGHGDSTESWKHPLKAHFVHKETKA